MKGSGIKISMYPAYM